MNRKIVMSAISIVGALSIMGGATFAAFSADNFNQGNTFAAGEMTLSINAQTGTSSPVFTSGNADNIAPGGSSSQNLTFKNEGSIAASALKVTGMVKTGGTDNFENEITVEFFDDLNANGIMDGSETSLGQAKFNAAVWDDYALPGVTLPAGETKEIGVKLTLDLDTPNSMQGANLNFNMEFQAVQ